MVTNDGTELHAGLGCRIGRAFGASNPWWPGGDPAHDEPEVAGQQQIFGVQRVGTVNLDVAFGSVEPPQHFRDTGQIEFAR
jgi:hypothetical protein